MIRPALASALAAAALAFTPAAHAVDWTEPVAGTLTSVPNAAPDYPDVANVGGVPTVGWSELGNSKTFVRQLTGESWSTLGGDSAISGFAGPFVRIADVGGVPYIAYQQWTPSGAPNQIRVRRFQGGAWEDVGGSLNIDTTKEAGTPAIANVGGAPYVAWREVNASNEGQIYVKRWNGSVWVEPAPGSLNIGGAITYGYDPFIADVGGVPYVAWGEDGVADDGVVYVKRWNGSAWVEPVPGTLSLDAGGESWETSIADVGGVPHVAWIEDTGGGPTETTQTIVKRLDGGSWTQVGGGPAEPDPTKDGGGVIASVGGQLWTALNQFDGDNYVSYVRRLDGSAWTTVGSPLNVDPSHSAITPRLADVGGIPYAIWREGTHAACSDFGFSPSNGCRVYVKRYGTPAPTPPPPTTALAIGKLAISPKAFLPASRGGSVLASAATKKAKGKKAKKTGTTVSYTLNQAGSVAFTVEAKQPGRKVKKSCRKQTRKNRKKPKCTRTVVLKGSFSHTGKAGANSFRFTGRLGGKKLKPGKYTLRASADKSQATASFTVKKPKKPKKKRAR